MNFKFDISELRKIIDSKSKKKPKRNVVHTIGYDKFSVKEIFRKAKAVVTNENNKKIAMDIFDQIKGFVQKISSTKDGKTKIKRWKK